MQSMLLTVGKLKERFWQEAAKEYMKRLSRFTTLTNIEIPDLPEPNNASLAQQQQVIEQEGDLLVQKIKNTDYVVVLDIKGKTYTSEEFSDFLQNQKQTGKRLVFIIGGSLGLSSKILQRADAKISFSPMTFPHQLARIILLEQWYRGEKIAANERYHK